MMNARTRLFLIVSVAFVLLLVPLNAPDVQATGPLIRLHRVTFDPLVEDPSLPPSLRRLRYPSGETRYYLVQFQGPVLEEWREDLGGLGAVIVDYVPDFALVARMDEQAADRAKGLAMVRWVGAYLPGYKISPDLDSLSKGSQEVMIQLFAGEDPSPVVDGLKSLGAEVLSFHANPLAGYVRAVVPSSCLPEMATLPAVSWVERYLPPTIDNGVGRDLMKVDRVWNGTGLYGSGQIATVCDTGLDSGDASTLSLDFRGRLLKWYALGRPPDDWSDPDGHGTHVAGSVLGAGVLSGSNPAAHDYAGSLAGVAPEAMLVFQSVEDAEGNLGGIPDDYSQLFGPPYADGARVHSNSWSGPTGGEDNPCGGYDAGARQVDEFIWTHQDMTILSSAGNKGTDANEDGVVDLDSMRSPATAKSIIAVGATESLRSSGGYERAWGSHWPDDYPERPISVDYLSNDDRGLAAFSSRGPADDGRIKPDLVAPGTNIVSVRSQTSDDTGWGVYDSNYVYMGGTSMSTPLVAGAAVLVRERYVRHQGWNPSAALVKATLVNGAKDLSPGQYPDGPCREIPPDSPNSVMGWGRVDLQAAIMPPEPRWILYEDNKDGLVTGGSMVHDVDISTGAGQALTAFVDIPLVAERAACPPPTRTGRGHGVLVRAPGTSPLHRSGSPVKGDAGESVASGCVDVVIEGGFEAGGYGWETEGEVWLSEYPHSGYYSAWLGGYKDAHDWLWQSVQFPLDVSRVTLSFWYDQDTAEEYPGGYDYFWVGFYDVDWGKILAEASYLDGVVDTPDWTRVEYRFDQDELDAVRGQTVHLAFEMKTDYADHTEVRVDDVSLEVCTGSAERYPSAFRATLVWSDYPGSLASARALVNDLDLEVIDPRGLCFRGNGGSQPDRVNTVEDVVIDAPVSGTYRVIVRGANVPLGPQPFALVISGEGGGTQGELFLNLPFVVK